MEIKKCESVLAGEYLLRVSYFLLQDRRTPKRFLDPFAALLADASILSPITYSAGNDGPPDLGEAVKERTELRTLDERRLASLNVSQGHATSDRCGDATTSERRG